MQIWFIGRTLASQAGETGSTPAICFLFYLLFMRNGIGKIIIEEWPL